MYFAEMILNKFFDIFLGQACLFESKIIIIVRLLNIFADWPSQSNGESVDMSGDNFVNRQK